MPEYELDPEYEAALNYLKENTDLDEEEIGIRACKLLAAIVKQYREEGMRIISMDPFGQRYSGTTIDPDLVKKACTLYLRDKLCSEFLEVTDVVLKENVVIVYLLDMLGDIRQRIANSAKPFLLKEMVLDYALSPTPRP